ncbi:hypothetical protein B484DRAFT_392679 [Ochromonadaceae sp. CCMP2298]|nr:hypothetical protein B484DRAFT_392679 [Ochromonadaceae sp. CCMP2298]
MSGYLYHKQHPMPIQESWLASNGFDPCQCNAHLTFDVYGRKIAALGVAYSTISSWLNSTINVCHEITGRFRAGAVGYNSMLRSLSMADGLMLEAARTILHEGGDLLSMLTNAMYEKEADRISHISKRVFMSQFSITDEAEFSASATSLFEFLMQEAAVKDPFWRCVDLPTAVARAIKLAFVGNSTSVHVTSNRVSGEQRAAMKTILQGHAVVGPLISHAGDILYKY